MKSLFNPNILFILYLILPFITLASISYQTPFNELTEIEILSKNNKDKYYCLILSSNKTDEVLISIANNTLDSHFVSNISLIYSYHPELNHPTIYCLYDGVLQFRKKVGILNNELISFLESLLAKSKDTSFPSDSSLKQSSTSQSFISIKKRDSSKEEHLKKIIIAIIVVLLLSISIVFIIKYSIDWALSSRLELNFQKEIKKKDAIEALIENSNPNQHQSQFEQENDDQQIKL